MEEGDLERSEHLKFLNDLKRAGKTVKLFKEHVIKLEEDVAMHGATKKEINLLTDIITTHDLGAKKITSLLKCLIPIKRMPNSILKCIMTWYLSSIHEIQVTVSIYIIQWVIGLWDYELADRNKINIYYDVLFYSMLKYQRLEKHIARLIYLLTQPEDVTRRNVSRLLLLQQKYLRPQKHIIALLLLFKSYKPELVPEKVEAINIENIWRPIPEALRLSLEEAKKRLDSGETCETNFLGHRMLKFSKQKKGEKILIPSVGYFHIGSSIFKETNAKSIFDINSVEDLGQQHLNIELPCNAVSLLNNMTGYHLLTYASFQYQSRFSYNLYNTLRRAFILENGKFSKEEMGKLLDMTIQFSRYMQRSILVVNLFIDEYLCFNNEEHQLELLTLLQWITSISVTEIRTVLSHVQNMFYESSLNIKCKIIETLRILIINLFVNHGFSECCQNTPAPFLGQGSIDDFADIVPLLTKIIESLIISGLNIHSYNVLLLSEALTFYEVICLLEIRSHTLLWTLAPPAVIYGGYVTKSCAILSRVCVLLSRYHDMIVKLRELQVPHNFEDKMRIVLVYIKEIITILLFGKVSSSQKGESFFISDLNTIAQNLECDHLHLQLSISNHCAFLPYKYTLKENLSDKLSITTTEDALYMADLYYPRITQFLKLLSTSSSAISVLE